jgi:hypothetical protein
LIAPAREERLSTNKKRASPQLDKVCKSRVDAAIIARIQHFDLLAERVP